MRNTKHKEMENCGPVRRCLCKHKQVEGGIKPTVLVKCFLSFSCVEIICWVSGAPWLCAYREQQEVVSCFHENKTIVNQPRVKCTALDLRLESIPSLVA